MKSQTTFTLQYAHRFLGFRGEAQYLHGHTGTLTIEVEDTVFHICCKANISLDIPTE